MSSALYADLLQAQHNQKCFAIVDCNNFYASCERLFRPELKHRPIVVLSNNDGCVIARSNEARELGIPMGAPAFQIQELLLRHKVSVFSSNFALYGDLSRRVMQLLTSEGFPMEIYSIDEAFLDLSGVPEPEAVARHLVKIIKQHTGIPVSVGIGATKAQAKTANYLAKRVFYVPFYHLQTDRAPWHLVPVGELWGIGSRHAKRLENRGVYTADQFLKLSEAWVKKKFTIMGLRLLYELRGLSCFPLEKKAPPRKNIRHARSFGKMLTHAEELKRALSHFTCRSAEKLRRQQSMVQKLSVFLLTNPNRPDLPQYFPHQSQKLVLATAYTPALLHTVMQLFDQIYKPGYAYKKAGVLFSEIRPANEIQAPLLEGISLPHLEREARLMATVDQINHMHGHSIVRFGLQGFGERWKLRQEKRSPRYTTRWEELMEVQA